MITYHNKEVQGYTLLDTAPDTANENRLVAIKYVGGKVETTTVKMIQSRINASTQVIAITTANKTAEETLLADLNANVTFPVVVPPTDNSGDTQTS